MYQYPTTVNATNYKLIPAGKFYTSRRNGPVLGIVLHITAGLQDLGLEGDDPSAEDTVKWALSRLPDVSWHVGVDSDSIVPCLPDTYTAWHAKDYNSRTFGIEISKTNIDWTAVPPEWVTATLKNAARALAPIVKKYGLPLVRCTKAEVDAAQAAGRPFGFTYHSYTSAGTRSDPGSNFPFSRLMDYIRAELAGTTEKDWFDMATKDDLRAVLMEPAYLREVAKYVAEGYPMGPADGKKVLASWLTQLDGLTRLAIQAANDDLTADEVKTALAEAVATGMQVEGDVRLVPKNPTPTPEVPA